jgi:hypothetical protein
MGGKEQRFPLGDQAAQALPDKVPGLWVKACCGLVKEYQIRIVYQGARQGQTPLHATGQGLDTRIGGPPSQRSSRCCSCQCCMRFL